MMVELGVWFWKSRGRQKASILHSKKTAKGNKMLTLDELLSWLKGKKGLYVEFEMKTKPVELYPEERLHKYCDMIYKKIKAVQPDGAEGEDRQGA